jgi:hypothetical protein
MIITGDKYMAFYACVNQQIPSGHLVVQPDRRIPSRAQTPEITPFPENGMTVGFALPGFCRRVQTIGTHVLRGAGLNEVVKACH